MHRYLIPARRKVDAFQDESTMLGIAQACGVFSVRWDKAMELFAVADICERESVFFCSPQELLDLAEELKALAQTRLSEEQPGTALE